MNPSSAYTLVHLAYPAAAKFKYLTAIIHPPTPHTAEMEAINIMSYSN